MSKTSQKKKFHLDDEFLKLAEIPSDIDSEIPFY